MKAFALLALTIVAGGCGGAGTTASSSPSASKLLSPAATVSVAPASVDSPSPPTSPSAAASLRLVYRTYDGSLYGLVAGNADGSGMVTLSGPNFVHPDLIRFIQSRNRRWAAWVDGGDLRVSASSTLSSAKTVATSPKVLSVLAVSEDGDSIAYEIHTTTDPVTAATELYVVHIHDRSIKLLRTFAGPFVTCLGDAAFDATAQRLIAVGCGSGQAAGLLVLNTSDGSIISEDDGFFAWPGQWAFAADLKTVWLIVGGTTESDVVRYDTATRARDVLYRSPVWRQPDGSSAPNLPGPVLLAPDQTDLMFSRYTQDRAPEVYMLPSSGGTETLIFKSATFERLESWSPDGGYVAISVDNSTPTQRMRLIDPQTRGISAVNTGAAYDEFLAWIAA